MKKTLIIMALGLTFGLAACSPTPPEAVPTAAPTIEIPIPLPPEFFPDGSLPVLDPPVFFPAIACTPVALIDAINRANRDPAHDTIILPPACIITLTDVDNIDGGVGPNGLPVIRTPITIRARYSGTDVVRVENAARTAARRHSGCSSLAHPAN